jgi:hypothetical protein
MGPFMSFVELLPGVLSLSRCDKLRLIQCLAEDLKEAEDSLSTSRNGMRVEGNRLDSSEVSINDIHREGTPPIEADPSYPFWRVDREEEAAAILMKAQEAAKSAS